MSFLGKAVVAVAAAGLAAGTVVGAGAANAAGLHGAIAFSVEDWMYGTAIDAANPQDAVAEALASCAWQGATDCKVMVTWADGCGALVYRDDPSDVYGVGTGAGSNREAALFAAYASLGQYYPPAMLANVGSANLSQTGISEVVCTANA